jgi:hypothetical protein
VTASAAPWGHTGEPERQGRHTPACTSTTNRVGGWVPSTWGPNTRAGHHRCQTQVHQGKATAATQTQVLLAQQTTALEALRGKEGMAGSQQQLQLLALATRAALTGGASCSSSQHLCWPSCTFPCTATHWHASNTALQHRGQWGGHSSEPKQKSREGEVCLERRRPAGACMDRLAGPWPAGKLPPEVIQPDRGSSTDWMVGANRHSHPAATDRPAPRRALARSPLIQGGKTGWS